MTHKQNKSMLWLILWKLWLVAFLELLLEIFWKLYEIRWKKLKSFTGKLHHVVLTMFVLIFVPHHHHFYGPKPGTMPTRWVSPSHRPHLHSKYLCPTSWKTCATSEIQSEDLNSGELRNFLGYMVWLWQNGPEFLSTRAGLWNSSKVDHACAGWIEAGKLVTCLTSWALAIFKSIYQIYPKRIKKVWSKHANRSNHVTLWIASAAAFRNHGAMKRCCIETQELLDAGIQAMNSLWPAIVDKYVNMLIIYNILILRLLFPGCPAWSKCTV